MERQTVNPAVTAGLLGTLAWGSPAVAYGAPRAAVLKMSLSMGIIVVGAGCLAGLAVAGIIKAVFQHIRRDEQIEEIEQWAESFRNRSSQDTDTAVRKAVVVEDAPKTDDEMLDDAPTGELPRRSLRRAQMQIEQDAERQGEASRASIQQTPRRPRHAAPARMVEAMASSDEPLVESVEAAPSSPEPRGRHAQRSSADVAPREAASARPRRAHMRHAVVQDWEEQTNVLDGLASRSTDVPVVSKSLGEGENYLDGSLHDPVLMSIDELLKQNPTPRRRRSGAPAHYAQNVAVQVPSIETFKPSEALGFDENPPTRSFARSLGTKAKSVASVLRERLSADVMDGVPIITRSDGSVGDIGTDIFSRPLIDPSRSTGSLKSPAIASEHSSRRRVRAHNMPTLDTREQYIANNVSEVELGLFPEHRGVEDLEGPDPWEAALEAMGKSMGAEADMRFHDVVGGPSTLDEPDDIEGPTGFIPYRDLSSQRRVATEDTKYADSTPQEPSNDADSSGANKARKYLRVIDGGTGSLRIRREIPVGDSEVSRRRGRHFAKKEAPLAREA